MSLPIIEFDTVIVGSGTSAHYAATGLSNAGQKIAIVDEGAYGGTCALRGCQPKKYIVCNAEAVAMAGHLVNKGIKSAPETDWPALQKLKDEFVDRVSEGEINHWKQAGVTTFHERAVMSGEDELTVGDQKIKAKHIILATGASPRRTKIPGIEHIKVSDDFLDLPQLPKRIIFIGGGYISFEFAHAAIRAGAEEVIIIHRSDKPLKAFDSDIVKVILEASTHAGIKVVLNESPLSVETSSGAYSLKTSSGEIYETDLIVEATGRIPNLSVLNGDAGKVASSNKGVEVNEFLQSTSNPRVYAIGDCAATPFMLATIADEEGKKAAQNILEGNKHHVDYSVLPSAVFTIPSIGTVGLTENQALQKKLNFRVNRGSTVEWPSSKRIGETHSGYKILIDKDTEEILGAHIARHNASEAINVLALAIKYRIKAPDLANFMWAYPTITSDLKYMVK